MDRRHRFLAALLIVILSLNCASAFAENSGKFGNLSWKLDGQGTLTVSGRGRMDSYTQPWDSLKSSIKKVIIEEGVLSVGSDNFSGCTNLKNVVLADSVTSIDAFAFDGCSNLKEVSFGKGLVSIGKYAFSSCGLRSVTLPDSVVILESNAFQSCSSLASVKLPKGLTVINDSLFEYCGSLTGIDIPDGVVMINNSAFYDCTELRSVTIPASVTYIDQYAFLSCEKLKDIWFKGTKSQWSDLTATTDFLPDSNVSIRYGSSGQTSSISFTGSSSSGSSSGSSSSSSYSDTLIGSNNITVSSKITYSKGKTTVTWTDSSNNSPYQVAFKCLDGSAEQSGFWAGGNQKESTTYSKSFTIDQLIPGHSYEISVYDSKDHVGTNTVTIPAAKSFQDENFKASSVKVDVSYRYVTESGSKKTPSAFILNQMQTYLHKSRGGCALYYHVMFPGTSTTKTYFLQIVITAPNGYTETIIIDDDMTINKSSYGYRFYWDCIGSDYFNRLDDKNGSIPVGDYKMELYMDGMLVNTSKFKVQR